MRVITRLHNSHFGVNCLFKCDFGMEYRVQQHTFLDALVKKYFFPFIFAIENQTNQLQGSITTLQTVPYEKK